MPLLLVLRTSQIKSNIVSRRISTGVKVYRVIHYIICIQFASCVCFIVDRMHALDIMIVYKMYNACKGTTLYTFLHIMHTKFCVQSRQRDFGFCIQKSVHHVCAHEISFYLIPLLDFSWLISSLLSAIQYMLRYLACNTGFGAFLSSARSCFCLAAPAQIHLCIYLIISCLLDLDITYSRCSYLMRSAARVEAHDMIKLYSRVAAVFQKYGIILFCLDVIGLNVGFFLLF